MFILFLIIVMEAYQSVLIYLLNLYLSNALFKLDLKVKGKR